jgi:hypothetical protein
MIVVVVAGYNQWLLGWGWTYILGLSYIFRRYIDQAPVLLWWLGH